MRPITANPLNNGSTCSDPTPFPSDIAPLTPAPRCSTIRILLMIPIYALVSWLSTFYYKHAVYYSVLGDCYEAFTISAFFALMCSYIAPDLHSQKDYFRAIQPKNWVWPITWLQKISGGKKGIWRVPRSGLTWFNVRHQKTATRIHVEYNWQCGC